MKPLNYSKMKRLIVLDLDNTLIYGTYQIGLLARILYKYSRSLIIYERPYAREFIARCHETGDVIVFSTAVRDYAEHVIQHLNIQPIEIYTREDCTLENGFFEKSLPGFYFEIYDEIIVVDDSPDVWDLKTQARCRFLIPDGFTGDSKDEELRLLLDKLI
jgi:TFIIF-interacting CTD phosphatase-like protein